MKIAEKREKDICILTPNCGLLDTGSHPSQAGSSGMTFPSVSMVFQQPFRRNELTNILGGAK
jgi:hypothetical protein